MKVIGHKRFIITERGFKRAVKFLTRLNLNHPTTGKTKMEFYVMTQGGAR